MAACAAVLLGTALQLQQAQLAPAFVHVWLAIAAIAALAWAWRKPRTPAWDALLCVALATLAFAQTGWRACEQQARRLPADREGQNMWVQGEVLGLPQNQTDAVRFRFRIDAWSSSANMAHAQKPPAHWVAWLGWYGALPPSVRAGERWRLPVRLKAPHGNVNPYGFDYELWLWEQDIAATGYVRAADGRQPVREQAGDGWSWARWRQAARDAIEREVSQTAQAGLIAALLMGDQASIERADWDVFRATGVAHLMAISGLHITGLAWLASCMAAALWRRLQWQTGGRLKALALIWPTPRVASVVAVCVAVFYAGFSGWGVPAQRTVWMLCVVHGLSWQGRRWPWPLTWIFVAATVVVFDPWALLQAGFALSFVAVGLLFASGDEGARAGARVSVSANGWGLPYGVAFLWDALRTLCREQVRISVCLAPLSLLLFHQVSLVGLLANVLAGPWVTLVVTPLCVAGLIVPMFWSWAAVALDVLMPMLQSLAAWPWAQWSTAAAPPLWGWLALCGSVGMAMPWPMWLRCVGLAWCVPLLTWQAPRPAAGQFELWAADMGQGHAVLLRTHSHALLYDTGPRYGSESDAGQRVIVPLLRVLDERLDRVMLSHQDIDHSGGLRAVLAMQPQADLLTSVAPTHPLMRGLAPQPCVRGQHWAWDGVRFEVLHPRDHDAVKPNALSCVLRVQDAQGVSALLVADIEAEQERLLLASGDVQPSDWLLVPHHGSNTSSTSAFLQAVRPRWAVVQAGYLNRYGHPREEVLQRYAREGIAVVQTTSCGAAVWRSGQADQMQCERAQHPRYWHHAVR